MKAQVLLAVCNILTNRAAAVVAASQAAAQWASASVLATLTQRCFDFYNIKSEAISSVDCACLLASWLEMQFLALIAGLVKGK